MRVISLVPSWTETLIEAGVNVVGRTRFCIHPEQKIQNIAVIGGTKKIDIKKIKELKPDLIILDQEENTLEIVQILELHGLKWFATHVTDVRSCSTGLLDLSNQIDSNQMLKQWSIDYLKITKNLILDLDLKNLNLKNISYVIWKNPWMCVGADTFIGDILTYFQIQLITQAKKYFEISENELKKTYCLFSTEPYPFTKEIEKLKKNEFHGQLIDGENISWFGIRNLNFMKSFSNN